MFDNILQSIDGVSVYPIFSLLIFFVFFLGLGIWVFRVDKDYLKKMSELPIEK